MKFTRLFAILLTGAAVLLLSVKAIAYPPADKQGVLYSDLQDLKKIAELQEIDLNESLGTVLQPNLVKHTLAPWKPDAVTGAFKEFSEYRAKVETKQIERMTNKQTYATLPDITASAMMVISGAITSPDNMYFASGRVVGRDHLESLATLIQSTKFLKSYSELARGITISDADALFLPSDVFITKNLAEAANTASDQKSSSSLIPVNTPVFIFGQVIDQPGLNPANDSWLVIWRPEFGLKFVRSRHIALVNQKFVSRYEELAKDNLQLACTDRLTAEFCMYRKDSLRRLTPVLKDKSNQHYIAASQKNTITSVLEDSINLQLYPADLASVTVETADSGQDLKDHLKRPETRSNITNGEYLSQVHNAMFMNPEYSSPNKNKLFAWGAGTVGINRLVGQDVSGFSYNLLQSLGINVPRHSWDQVIEGRKQRTVFQTEGDVLADIDTLYEAMIEKCTLGNIASFGRGNIMVCLGSLTVEQLDDISPEAAAEARARGMQENSRVPLVASSPVGFRNGEQWDIVPETAVFPIFKHGDAASRSWVSRGKLFIFSYLKPVHTEL